MITLHQRKMAAQREALDVLFNRLRGLVTKIPKDGWVRAIRKSLGMSSMQLADRAGVEESTLIRLEQNEQKGTITLASLKKLADALDADFVYCLVPRSSLHDALERQAERLLNATEGQVEKSMQLEEQGSGKLSGVTRAATKAMLMVKLDKRLWERR